VSGASRFGRPSRASCENPGPRTRLARADARPRPRWSRALPTARRAASSGRRVCTPRRDTRRRAGWSAGTVPTSVPLRVEINSSIGRRVSHDDVNRRQRAQPPTGAPGRGRCVCAAIVRPASGDREGNAYVRDGLLPVADLLLAPCGAADSSCVPRRRGPPDLTRFVSSTLRSADDGRRSRWVYEGYRDLIKARWRASSGRRRRSSPCETSPRWPLELAACLEHLGPR